MKRCNLHQGVRRDEGAKAPWAALACGALGSVDDDVETLIEIWRERYGYARDTATADILHNLSFACAPRPVTHHR
ncbi:MAG: hypothetical protein U0359_33565 [Byssovorax sp.]